MPTGDRFRDCFSVCLTSKSFRDRAVKFEQARRQIEVHGEQSSSVCDKGALSTPCVSLVSKLPWRRPWRLLIVR